MGRAHHEAGRVSEAEIALEKAITLSPANLVANRLLGDIAMQNGDHGKALERYTMLQQLNPGDPEIELLIARCEAALPEIQEALVKGEPTVKVTHAEARAAAQAPAAAAESAPTPALEETAPVSAPEPQAGREPAETQEAAAPEIGPRRARRSRLRAPARPRTGQRALERPLGAASADGAGNPAGGFARRGKPSRHRGGRRRPAPPADERHRQPARRRARRQGSGAARLAYGP
jgi:tetratricopeptide (TPR) repeat protein